jgi:RNA polymerase sigma-70 factor, ECF subfamily
MRRDDAVRTDELALRARAGDREAYAALIRLHEPRLLAVAFGRSGGREDALDAVQEAVLVGLDRVGGLREPSAFLPWMEALVASRCARLRERFYRTREVPLDGEDEAVRDPDPTDRLWVEELLTRLREPHRSAIRGFYLGGQSVGDLALALERPAGTVKRWLLEGRALLGTMMEEAIEMAEDRTKRWLVVAGVDLSDSERAQIEEAAARAGCVCRHCDEPSDALPLLEELHPPILVLGERLDGPCNAIPLLLWLGHLNEQPDAQVTKAVVLGRADDRSIFIAWRAGAECYLTRPFKTDELACFVSQLLHAMDRSEIRE